MYDTIICSGTIVDGTGRERFDADLGIADGRIAGLGDLSSASARTRIDAVSKIVAPGFIDIHTHSDLTLLLDPRSESLVSQGVTSQIVGNCGMSVAPILADKLTDMEASIAFLLSGLDIEVSWDTLSSYLARLENAHCVTNVATLVGHGTLRAFLVGMRAGRLDAANTKALKALLSDCLSSGALGVSTGLIYPPGSYADFDELKGVVGVTTDHKKVYASHLRGYRGLLGPSLNEAIRLARMTQGKVHVSHMKAAGENNRGRASNVLEWIDKGRAEGADVTYDVYPYEAGNTTLLSVFPPWVRSGGSENLRKRLRDSKVRRRLATELFRPQDDWEPLLERDGWDDVLVVSFKNEANKEFEGQNLLSIAEKLGVSPIDAMCNLLLDEDLVLNMINFHVDEADVEALLLGQASMVASDSIAVGNGEHTKNIRPHPRFYGTFPRIIAKYVRERPVMSLEEAIHKMTAKPASRFGLRQRGTLQLQNAADIVVFDEETISDRATYERPRERATGIDVVLVNGEVVFENGELTGNCPGTVIR